MSTAVQSVRPTRVAGRIAGLRGILPADGLRGARVLAIWALWAIAFYIPMTTSYALRARWGVAVLLGGLGWLLLIQNRQPQGRRLLPAVVAFVGMSALSILYSYMTDYSALRVANFVLLIGGSVGLCTAVIRSPDGLRKAFFVMLVASMAGTLVIAVSGLGAEINLSDAGARFQGADELRATGAAALIAATMPMLMWCARYSNPSWKSFYTVFGLYLTVLILATKARSGIGMAAVTWPLTWTLMRTRNVSVGWILLLVFAAVGGIVLQSSESLRQSFRLEGRDDLSTGRFERWQICIDKWKLNPLQGYGFGTSRYHHLDQNQTSWSLQSNRANQSVTHNEHITVLYELGLLGIMLYWMVMICVVRAGLQAIRMPPGVYRDLVVVVFMSWCAHAMNTMAHDPNLSAGHPGAYMFWMKAAFVCCGVQLLVYMRRQKMLAAAKQKATGNTADLRRAGRPMYRPS